MDKPQYKGHGEHSVSQLEKIIDNLMEELHLIRSGQVAPHNTADKQTPDVSDDEIERLAIDVYPDPERNGPDIFHEGDVERFKQEAFIEGMKLMRFLLSSKQSEADKIVREFVGLIDEHDAANPANLTTFEYMEVINGFENRRIKLLESAREYLRNNPK
jgi:hypothetical protein